jgi:hypothetical protein
MTSAVELTVFAKHADGAAVSPLSKVISLDGSTVVSDGSSCVMSHGEARRLPIASADALAQVIAGLSSQEALSLGRLRDGLPARVEVITQRKLHGLNGQAATIARTKEFLEYRSASPGYVLVDFDRKGMPAAVESRLDAAGGPWAALCAICPGLARAERVSRASTSSGLFHAESGQRYHGSGGEHFYVAVADAADAERFLHALHARIWLAGFAWYDVGAAGQLLDRSLVDRMVGGPERLIFEGAPVVRAPLAQDPAARRPVVTAGDIVDTRRICPQLTAFERAQLAELQRADRERVAETAQTAQARFIARQASRLVDRHGVTLPMARRMVEAQIAGVLLPFIALPWDDPALADCTVADVLADPQRFVDETLADPLEGIPYGRTKAMVMQRPDGSLWIHSFAHGRTIYDLRYDAAALDRAIRATPKEEMVEVFLRLSSVASLTPDEVIRLRDLVCALAGVKVRPLDLRIKRGKEERERKQAAAARQKQAAERTDPRPRRPAPSVEDERLPVLTDLDAILCQVPDPEPPMRDVAGQPIEIQVRRPLGLHALTEAGGDDEEPEEKRLPPPELPLLTAHDDISLAHMIERYVEYAICTDTTERVVALPGLFVNHYRGYRASKLPVVAGIVTAPLVLHTGELLADVGLRRDLNLVFRIDPALLAVLPRRAEIKPRHVAAALRFLHDEWFVDVLTDFTGKMVLTTLGLTIIERVLLPERPGFIVTAGLPGGGKTTAIIMVVAAVTGLRPPAAAWSPSEEERRKALLSYFSQALAVLVWDNIPRGTAIFCPAIEKSLTSPSYQDRILGETAIRAVPSTTIQAFTGNNIAPVGDMTSRTLSCFIDVTRPDPENRPVKRIDPVGWTFAHRAKILRALYTILLGNPRFGDGPHAAAKTRFRTWWHLCGAPLEHAAGLLIKEQKDWFPGDLGPAHMAAKPLDFVELFRAHEDNDDESNALAGLLERLKALWPDSEFPDGFRADQIVEKMINYGPPIGIPEPELRSLFDALGQKPLHIVNAHIVGNRLRMVLNHPVVVEGSVLILRRRGKPGGRHAAAAYTIEQRKRP